MKSIRIKLLVFTFILVIFLCVSNLISGALTSYDGILRNVEKDLHTAGQLADKAISTNINLAKMQAETVGRLKILTDNTNVREKLAFLEPYKVKNDYLYVSLVDEQGTINTSSSGKGTVVADEELFKRALAGETVLSSPHLNDAGELLLDIYTPVSKSWVLITSLDGLFLSNIINDIRVGETGNVFVLNESGTMIANMRPNLVQESTNFIEMAKADTSYESIAVVYNQMIAGESGIAQYSYGDVPRICYFAPLSGMSGWSFGIAAPIKEMTSSITKVVVTMVIVSAALAIVGILVSLVFAGKIANPLIRITNRMKLLAEGDLTTPVPDIRNKDEIGALANSITASVNVLSLYIDDIARNMEEIAKGNLTTEPGQQYIGDFQRIEVALRHSIGNLSDTLSQINVASSQVASGSDQVSAGAQTLAQGATEQASSVEELSATISDIAEQVSKNAQNAQNADTLAIQSESDLDRSSEQMQEMLSAIKRIDEKSGEIGKIIKTIDDIAFQTNILALNAAVEAARAGSAGKGFAVVADEVRNLASKSADAAKQTTALIEDSIQAVADGTRIADDTARTMQVIVSGVQSIVETIAEISRASQEQATSIKQINQGVDQISGVVQNNSATAEESASASEELSGQAQILNDLVGNFRIKDSQFAQSQPIPQAIEL